MPYDQQLSEPQAPAQFPVESVIDAPPSQQLPEALLSEEPNMDEAALMLHAALEAHAEAVDSQQAGMTPMVEASTTAVPALESATPPLAQEVTIPSANIEPPRSDASEQDWEAYARYSHAAPQ